VIGDLGASAAATAARDSAGSPRVLISCGEASGDLYAGALVHALRAQAPGVAVSGLGGECLRAAGASLIGDYRGLSVTGLTEAAVVLSRSWRMLGAIGHAAAAARPDVFVPIDFPDFNFRLLPVMRRLGVPIVYYVSPQLWAWRPGRLRTIRRYIDRMLVIFPFEVELYERAGVPVEFVGHPLVDLAVARRPRADVLAGAGLRPEQPVVSLLPGSRPNEVTRLLPGLLAAARLIRDRVRGAQFLIARAPALDEALFAPARDAARAGLPVATLERAADDVLAAGDVVVTASGTATVQAALHGRPLVIVYRLSPLSSLMARAFLRLETYGMVNLVAGRRIVPELIQSEFTPTRVADETVSLLTDRARADAMRRDLAEVRARLGGPGASARAAAVIKGSYPL
jgi:lipid-A-disaccharide synthase